MGGALILHVDLHPVTSGPARGHNLLNDAAMVSGSYKARGYRLHKNVITLAYLIAGRLNPGISG